MRVQEKGVLFEGMEGAIHLFFHQLFIEHHDISAPFHYPGDGPVNSISKISTLTGFAVY